MLVKFTRTVPPAEEGGESEALEHVVEVDLLPLIMGKLEATAAGIPAAAFPGVEVPVPAPFAGFGSVSVVVSIDAPLMPAGLIKALNPFSIKVWRCADMPDQPATADQIDGVW